jgi:OmpA family protein/PEGA domain-containing protein
MQRLAHFLGLVVAIALFATVGFAQDGKLKIKVTPKQAYVFVDGNAIREGSHSISLSPGKHTVVVVNYGYKISTQDVTIEAGKSTPLEVKLDSYGGTVAGPFGDVELKGDERAAVLSNGTTPGYFVGHVDEMNFDWIWHQNLLLPPGTHHLTVTHAGKTVWSGDVTVVANKKVIVQLASGTQKTVDWPRGEKLKDVPRFKVGIASAQIAVAPATGSFSSSTANINCGQSSTLTWNTTETVDANISGIGTVATSGSQSVSPHQTTTYDFTSGGPGGVIKGSSTVNVNTKVDASISANPTEVHYRKIGDKVITQDSSTVTWQTSNADSVTVDGQKVDLSGNETVKAEPMDSSQVPDGGQARTIDESKTFTLNATNVCGGSATQTAAMHVTGSVEPIPAVVLQSVFYPTDYPDKKHPQIGLVRSQQLALATLAGGFKKYLEYDPDAKLSVEAHADERGSKPFNQDLSERRVERIKQYLVDQGISADKVETAAYGKEQPLDRATVGTLEMTNPSAPPKPRLRDKRADWLAYNRRADIVLLPSGKKSAQFFPHNADDSKLIWQVPKPPLSKVQADQ